MLHRQFCRQYACEAISNSIRNDFFFPGAAPCKLHVNACPECVATPLFLAFDFVWKTTNENNRRHMHSGASCTLDYCVHFRCVGETCTRVSATIFEFIQACAASHGFCADCHPSRNLQFALLLCLASLQMLARRKPKIGARNKKNPCRVEASLPLFCCCCNELTMRKDKLGAGLNRDFVQDACRYIEACGMDCSSCSLRNSFSR